jgi:hypothetical protein
MFRRRANPEETIAGQIVALESALIMGACRVFLKISAPSRKAESANRLSHAIVKTTSAFLHS